MGNEEEIKKRSSNFELLKIILVLMIIILHYFNGKMGGLLSNVEKGTLNYYISHLLESLCIIAVNVFIIITGYFSCKKTSVQISKPMKLYIISIFYGIVLSIAVIFFTRLNINISVLKQLEITIFSRWFVVIYCILYLLIPYINKLVNAISKKQFQILLFINILFFYIWNTIFTTTTIADGGYGIVNFVNMYLVGAYIKIHNNKNYSKKISVLIYLICTLITTVYSFVAGRAWSYATIFNLISSIAVFELFKSLKIKNNKIINELSTYTFSTYIIHENSFFVLILYRNICRSNEFWNSNFMVLNMITSVICIYIICIVIEFLRRLIFRKLIDENIDKYNIKISCE